MKNNLNSLSASLWPKTKIASLKSTFPCFWTFKDTYSHEMWNIVKWRRPSRVFWIRFSIIPFFLILPLEPGLGLSLIFGGLQSPCLYRKLNWLSGNAGYMRITLVHAAQAFVLWTCGKGCGEGANEKLRVTWEMSRLEKFRWSCGQYA